MPTHFIDTPESSSGNAIEHTRSAALAFWRSFAQSDNEKARASLKFLTELRGEGGEDLYAVSLESPESTGKFVKVELPDTSPRNVQDAWDSEKKTRLMLVSPLEHCLAFDGDISKYQGGEFFVACASKGSTSLDAGACKTGTHSHADRVKVAIDEPAFLVKVRPSSPSTKPKVLAGALLYERDLPPMLASDVFEEVLQDFEAPPRVWKLVLDHYPGIITMSTYLNITGTPSVNSREQSVAQSVRSNTSRRSEGRVPIEVGVMNTNLAAEENDPLDAQMLEVFNQRQRVYTGRLGLDGVDFDSASSVGTGSWSVHSFSGLNRNPPNSTRSVGQMDADRWAQAWRPPVAKLDKQLKLTRSQVAQRFDQLERNVDTALGSLDKNLELEFSGIAQRDEAMRAAFNTTTQRVEVLENDVQRLARRETIPGGRLTVDTTRTGSQTPPPSFKWGSLSLEDQRELIGEVIDHLDLTRISEAVSAQLSLGGVKRDVELHGGRLTKLEQEFTTEHGAIAKLQTQMDKLEAGKNNTSCERGGYVFSDVTDVQALVQLIGPGKLVTRCLDLHALLTLAQDPYVSYEAGMQVHAAAIKANFGSVVESRIKVSFEIPFPELIVKMVENAATVSRGGAKWAPMFQSAEKFEDDFRDGAHRRVLRGIENAYELTQKAIDQEFPLGIIGPNGGNNRKIHSILTDQNRRAYRQTVGFIECLLPFYRTLKGGSLSSEESWDRVFVFVLELLTSLQEERVVSTDLSEEAAMIWGCFRATDLAEEFRKQKFVEHPKALSILALTSIEREGKTMQKLEERMAKQIADAAKGDKFTKLDTKLQQLDNKIKNIIAKNPDLK